MKSHSKWMQQTSTIRVQDQVWILQEIKIDYTTEWYMYKPESILENETYEILLKIQTDHHIRLED